MAEELRFEPADDREARLAAGRPSYDEEPEDAEGYELVDQSDASGVA